MEFNLDKILDNTKYKNKPVFALNEYETSIGQLKNFKKIKQEFVANIDRIISGQISIKRFYEQVVIPMIEEGERIQYTSFLPWANKIKKQVVNINKEHRFSPTGMSEGLSAKERERKKLVQQETIREDVAEVTHSFMQMLKEKMKDPEALKKMTSKEILELYRVIRQEEDRAKELTLKIRSNEREEIAFQMMLEQSRAGQLNPEDFEFLEAGIKNELLTLKQNADGVYQVPDTR